MSTTAAVPDPFHVSLPTYDGPLDLLLQLVRQQKVPVEELPLATVTQQYLAYLEAAEAYDVRLSAEWVYLAATLIQLKSRLLLPQEPEVAARGTDLRKELVDRLREHERLQGAARSLGDLLDEERARFSSGGPALFPAPDLSVEPEEEGPRCATLADYLAVYRRAVERAEARQVLSIPQDPHTVEDRGAWLEGWFAENGPGPVALQHLVDRQPTRAAQCALFLAALELALRGEVHLDQEGPDAPALATRCAAAEEAPAAA